MNIDKAIQEAQAGAQERFDKDYAALLNQAKELVSWVRASPLKMTQSQQDRLPHIEAMLGGLLPFEAHDEMVSRALEAAAQVEEKA